MQKSDIYGDGIRMMQVWTTISAAVIISKIKAQEESMPLCLDDMPKDAEVINSIIEKTLNNGMLIEVYLVKYPRQYEAALFINGNYKPGPPLPRPLETPTDTAAYWMGVRPKVGLSQAEGDEILGCVNVQNKLHHCCFIDNWGVVE